VAAEGAEFVITRYRDAKVNLRTQLERILTRAGVKQWPKLFQNLRSSRETELAQRFPIHIVCAWLGNSRPVAMEHYLQVRDEDFARAATEVTPVAAPEVAEPEKAKRKAKYAEVTGGL
jgi:hypothetical protein